MKIHANARTCPNSRRLLVKRVEEENWPLMSAAEATAALPGWLDHYNSRRRHGSLGHRPPAARLAELEQRCE